MKFALLCPGESLRSTWRGGAYDHVVAITSAIHAEPQCDIWCVAENPAHKHQGRYRLFAERFFEIRPTIWTLGQLAVRWHNLWDIPQDHPIIEKGMQPLMAGLGWPMKHKWAQHVPNGHSFFRALFGALDAGATELHIYGHDMAGAADFNPATGEAISNNKAEKEWEIRWKVEQMLWKDISQTLSEAGVSLKESDFGTSSLGDRPVSRCDPKNFSEDRRLRSIERSVSEIELMWTSGRAGTTPSGSSNSVQSESIPTSDLPSSFGLVQKDSGSACTQPSGRSSGPFGKKDSTRA